MPQIVTEQIRYFLEKKEFINVGTCDFSGRPNVAPKFIAAVKGSFIYLADYVFGKTFNNLKINPRVSLSTIDLDNLTGYQINGTVRILLKGGNEYKKVLQTMRKKQVDFSVSRLIEGVQREKKYTTFEVTLPEKVCFFKIMVHEIVEIGITGKLLRKHL
jgi:predicted pyridoxine 5'-phosphate oxidase superfamily flavin-nucleotide-binding protein